MQIKSVKWGNEEEQFIAWSAGLGHGSKGLVPNSATGFLCGQQET